MWILIERFRLDKCAACKRESVVGTEVVWLSDGNIPDMQDSRRSLRILQANRRRSRGSRPQPKNPKEMVWRSRLHGKNKVPAVKPTLLQSRTLLAADIETKKVQAVHEGPTPTAAPWGSTPRDHRGGRWTGNIRAAVQDETTINTHIRNTAPGDALLSGQHKPGVEEQLEASRQDKPRHCTRHHHFEEVSNINQQRLKWKTAQRSHRGSTTTAKIFVK